MSGRKPLVTQHTIEPDALILWALMPKGNTVEDKGLKARPRKNSLINFGGKIFTSPSLAGQVACKRVSCNGWKFWTLEAVAGRLGVAGQF